MTTKSGQPAAATPQDNKQSQRVWAVFGFRDFTWLWLSGLTMMVTMNLRVLASGQWLYDQTGDAATLGYLGLIQFVQMPVSLFGGILADTMDRKKLMVMTQVVAFATTGSLAIISATGELKPWHIYVITGVTGIVGSLGNAARPAMMSRVVPKSYVQAAVTINTTTMQIASVVAPLIFGEVFTRFGVTTTFAIASVIAGVSVFNPLFIKASGTPDGGARKMSVKVLKEGWGYILKHPILPGLYMLDIGVTVVSFYRMLFPIFAEQFYDCKPPGGVNECARTVGWLNSANSIGAIGGGFLVLGASRFQRKGLMVLWATLAYSLILFAFAINRDLYLGLLIVVGLGLADAITMVMRQTIVQLTTPDNLLGRASSAHSFAAMGANNIGQTEVAFMSKWAGAGPTMLVGGFVATGVTLFIWWRLPGIRRYRYIEGQAIPPHDPSAPAPSASVPAAPAAQQGGGSSRSP